MLTIAIDGACRRNGKPDCTAAGGAFYYGINNEDKAFCGALSNYEYSSTNQRGELLALLKALDLVLESDEESVTIITDSEYIFNAMTKEWYRNWHNKGWVTAAGEPVKNRDIWLEVLMLMNKCMARGVEALFYHIKGHCISFGRVTAERLMDKDPTCMTLWNEMCKKYDSVAPTKTAIFNAAQELSKRNNGFALQDNTLKLFVVMNTMADAVASRVVDDADSSRKR